MAVSHVVKCRKFCFIIDVSRVYAITTILSNHNSHKLTRTGGCLSFSSGKNKDLCIDNTSEQSTRPCQEAPSHKIQKKVRLDEKKTKEISSPKFVSSRLKDKYKETYKDKDKDRKRDTSSSSDDEDSDKEKDRNKDKYWDKYKGIERDDDDDDYCKEVTIEYYRGLPQITVPLPSRRERCRFTLRPITNTVGDFLNMLRLEDGGVDHVSVSTPLGIRIASSNTIEVLMEDDFRLIINDICYHVKTPQKEKLSSEEIERLSDLKNLVHQLYEALNVEEHQIKKERELCEQLEELKTELEPMEQKRLQLHNVAERKTNVMAWVGLGLMSVQFGILARLTWWEYSWDIMEPVTYFVTYGNAIAAYAYYVLTKEEYVLPQVKDRQYLLTLHKKAKKLGLDLDRYNQIKEKIFYIENDLRRLRDPLQVHLPPHHLGDSFKKSTNPFMRAFNMFQKKPMDEKPLEENEKSAKTKDS